MNQIVKEEKKEKRQYEEDLFTPTSPPPPSKRIKLNEETKKDLCSRYARIVYKILGDNSKEMPQLLFSPSSSVLINSLKPNTIPCMWDILFGSSNQKLELTDENKACLSLFTLKLILSSEGNSSSSSSSSTDSSSTILLKCSRPTSLILKSPKKMLKWAYEEVVRFYLPNSFLLSLQNSSSSSSSSSSYNISLRTVVLLWFISWFSLQSEVIQTHSLQQLYSFFNLDQIQLLVSILLEWLDDHLLPKTFEKVSKRLNSRKPTHIKNCFHFLSSIYFLLKKENNNNNNIQVENLYWFEDNYFSLNRNISLFASYLQDFNPFNFVPQKNEQKNIFSYWWLFPSRLKWKLLKKYYITKRKGLSHLFLINSSLPRPIIRRITEEYYSDQDEEEQEQLDMDEDEEEFIEEEDLDREIEEEQEEEEEEQEEEKEQKEDVETREEEEKEEEEDLQSRETYQHALEQIQDFFQHIPEQEEKEEKKETTSTPVPNIILSRHHHLTPTISISISNTTHNNIISSQFIQAILRHEIPQPHINYWCLERNNLVESILNSVSNNSEQLKLPLRVRFTNEEQVNDQGGVKKECFELFFQQFFNLNQPLWNYDSINNSYWPLRTFTKEKECFQFLIGEIWKQAGMVYGLSIYHGRTICLQLPGKLFHYLWNQHIQQKFQVLNTSITSSPSFSEIEVLFQESFPTQALLLNKMKNFTAEDWKYADLSFECLQTVLSITNKEIDEMTWSITSIKEKINNKTAETFSFLPNNLINETNFPEYYEQYVRFQCSLHSNLEQFMEGILEVIHPTTFSFFTAKEFEKLFCEQPEITCDDLEDITIFRDFNLSKKNELNVHEWFWEILKEWSPQQLMKFVIFSTSSRAIPNSLNIYCGVSNDLLLPSSHTCFNSVYLPLYSSKQIMQEKLNFILDHSEGFGLQ